MIELSERELRALRMVVYEASYPIDLGCSWAALLLSGELSHDEAREVARKLGVADFELAKRPA